MAIGRRITNKSEPRIFETIFDAFRHFAPTSPLLKLETDESYFFQRTNHYELLNMGDGTIGAFPGFPMNLYRGEYKKYGSSKASIYRSKDPDDVVIDELRIIEFKNILKAFPQVQYAIDDHMRVDYLALAQHYGLNTNLIDVTSEPEIAAYFATHRWIDGVATPVTEGIGCIHGFTPLFFMRGKTVGPKLHMIGLQCFQRPGIQAAYGIELDRDESLAERGWTVYFKQTEKASRLIHMNFHIDEKKVDELRRKGAETFSDKEILGKNSWLFPDEDIAEIAKRIKKSKTISQNAIQEYEKSCEDVLKRKGIQIVDKPGYVLDDKTIKELAEQYKDRPYGDVKLTARLTCTPTTNSGNGKNCKSDL